MRKPTSDRRIVALLLFALMGEGALLAWHLGWRIQSDVAPSQQLAGTVAASENQLRRRGLNSLVWETASANQPVYFHDSILTLKQSTARLRLFKDTDLSLNENTLVTIEPPDDTQHGAIRLRFTRGALRARNPYQAAQLQSDQWTVDVQSGSEIEFRDVGRDRFELHVAQGGAVFRSTEKTEAVGPSGALEISGKQAEAIVRDAQLVWVKKAEERIYTHGDTTRVSLGWSGAASSLLVQTSGEETREVKLETTAQTLALELPLGKHFLILNQAGKRSVPLPVQVWRAPLLHLLQPLPRTRVRVGEMVQFVWTKPAGVTSFETRWTGSTPERSEVNLKLRTFSEVQDVEWSVHGFDAEGFLIPPLYSYPLFIRQDPLAAPKLKTPQMRAPAGTDKGASLWRKGFQRVWNEIWPQAWAEAPLEAVFEWERVNGADQYVIEIADAPDFRAPLVIKTVTASQFVWRGFARQAYFWRVAAGTKRGRLGVFSEPAKVDFAQPLAALEGVSLRPVAPPQATVNAPVTVEKPVENENKSAVKISEIPEAIDPKLFSRSLAWKPFYLKTNSQRPESVRVRLDGVSTGGAEVQVPFRLDGEKKLWLRGSFSQLRLKPDPETQYPQQKRLLWREIEALGLWTPRWWGYGLQLRSRTDFQRASYETIEEKNLISAGPAVGYRLSFGSWLLQGNGSLMIGSGQQSLELQQSVQHSLREQFFIGAGARLEWLFPKSSQLTGFGLVGLEF